MTKNRNIPLMPRGTAIWLIESTSLTFKQIGDFCGLHELEIEAMANGEVDKGAVGADPVKSRQLTREEINRCQSDPEAKLQLSEEFQNIQKTRDSAKKTGKYVPRAIRMNRPDAIAWLLKHCPEMTNAQIVKLVGTTKTMIESIRERTHWNMQSIKPKDPVLLGFCTQVELNALHGLAKKKASIANIEDLKVNDKSKDDKFTPDPGSSLKDNIEMDEE